MIYRINIKTDKNKKDGGKEFYLTADSPTQLYARARKQYGVDPKFVDILEEIDESTIDINKVKNKTVGKAPINEDKFEKLKKKSKKVETKKEATIDLTEANELLNKAYKITEAEKERLLTKWKPLDLDQEASIAGQVAEKLKCKHKKAKLYLTKNKENNKYEYLLLIK